MADALDDLIEDLACTAIGYPADDMVHDEVRFLRELRELRPRLAEAERDAARYRWLRDVEDTDVRTGGVYAHERAFDGYHFLVKGERLDAAIDAAMAAETVSEVEE